jgi:hypothetical protein
MVTDQARVVHAEGAMVGGHHAFPQPFRQQGREKSLSPVDHELLARPRGMVI